MKNFADIVAERCSVRAYSRREVEEEKLQYVLECGRLAPSAVNRQPWKMYIIGPDTRQEVWEQVWKAYDREWFREAPYVLVCTILHKESWKRSVDGKDHGDIDIAILTEHLCLAAAEQSLGTCWVCNFDPTVIRQVLNLPNNEEPAVLLPLGYSSDDFIPKERTRKALEEIVVKM